MSFMALPKLDLDSLSPDDRLALIERLWDSLTPDDVGLTPNQRDELASRVADADLHPGESVSWEEAQRRIRERKR
jgi:putative addiction module component (TIGR02574 family)